ncbi:hypothetical protein AWJ19_33135 [Paenibacillus sp. DMB5]|nr:hypothetical protein AWJ19_33135 [Paenibacillus sp. DMB5]
MPPAGFSSRRSARSVHASLRRSARRMHQPVRPQLRAVLQDASSSSSSPGRGISTSGVTSNTRP